ncbi:MAG: YhjD/YihY/BrkB family envelope integrity protein [Mycobacteriales bacterium]
MTSATQVRAGPDRRERLRRLWQALLDSFPGHVGRRSNELNLIRECLALAAEQTLCTIPLLVALQAVTQRFDLDSVGTALSHYLGLSNAATTDVQALFISTGHVGFLTLVVSLAVSLVFATGVGAIQQHAYEDIWYLPRCGLRSLWRQVLWVGGLCVYLALALYAGRIGRSLGSQVPSAGVVAHLVRLAFVLGVSFVFYLWTQRVLLGGRVPWRHLVPGSVAMAAATTGLVALSPLLSDQIVSQVKAYGLIGATFVLSVWLLALSVVLFFGALVGSVWAERRLLDAADPGERPQ